MSGFVGSVPSPSSSPSVRPSPSGSSGVVVVVVGGGGVVVVVVVGGGGGVVVVGGGSTIVTHPETVASPTREVVASPPS